MTDAPKRRRMGAYYYGFDPTGSPVIDKVLGAVACAGKAFHNTAEWNDDACAPYDDHEGVTPIEWIQNAAQEAADRLAEAEAEIERLRDELDTALMQRASWQMSALTDTASAGDAPCERCAGNGEVVTDWDTYLHGGDAPEAGTADCPDCDGTGQSTASAGDVRRRALEEYVLVPREPTEVMMQAGLYHSSHDTEWADAYSMWVGMIEAALDDATPPQPVPTVQEAIDTAVWGFRAFARGIAHRDVKEERMSQQEAEAWVDNSVADFRRALSQQEEGGE